MFPPKRSSVWEPRRWVRRRRWIRRLNQYPATAYTAEQLQVIRILPTITGEFRRACDGCSWSADKMPGPNPFKPWANLRRDACDHHDLAYLHLRDDFSYRSRQWEKERELADACLFVGTYLSLRRKGWRRGAAHWIAAGRFDALRKFGAGAAEPGSS